MAKIAALVVGINKDNTLGSIVHIAQNSEHASPKNYDIVCWGVSIRAAWRPVIFACVPTCLWCIAGVRGGLKDERGLIMSPFVK